MEEREKDVHVIVGEREKCGLLFPACKRRRGVKGVDKRIIERCDQGKLREDQLDAADIFA